MKAGDEGAGAIILAGGDGTRLLSLTRIARLHLLKQFCRILGKETLFEQTRRRVALSFSLGIH